jgi:hypothetical protein
MLTLQESYATRPIRFLELWQEGDWRLKLYSITYQRTALRPGLVGTAKTLARARLAESTVGKQHYGVGFVGIHDGRGAIFIFVDFWADENELHHHVYVAPSDQPDQFTYMTPTGLAACVWDLRVLCFERQAWLDAVLANPAGPDLEAYLTRQLNEDG